VHQHYERLARLVLHDERLDDVMLRHVQRARGHFGTAVLDVPAQVLRKKNIS
jgi:hypothetical protein